MVVRERPVSEIMHTEVAVLAPDERLDLADDVMRLGQIRHMPVVEDGRLVGILSSRDVLAASLATVFDIDEGERRTFRRSVDVREVMSQPVATVAPDATLREAGELMVKRKISCAPVVDRGDVLVGLVTVTDLLEASLLKEGDGGANEREVESVSEIREKIDREIDELRRTRDEIRVQLHLAKSEAQELWSSLEHKLAGLESHAKHIAKQVEEPLEDVSAAARLLVDELREGYRRIKDAL